VNRIQGQDRINRHHSDIADWRSLEIPSSSAFAPSNSLRVGLDELSILLVIVQARHYLAALWIHAE